jgi:hypothetical protein
MGFRMGRGCMSGFWITIRGGLKWERKISRI